MLRARYAVSFEFDTKPPLTTSGELSALKAPTVVARAVRKAILEHPQQVWRSLVVVLERQDG